MNDTSCAIFSRFAAVTVRVPGYRQLRRIYPVLPGLSVAAQCRCERIIIVYLFDDKGTDIGVLCRHGHGAEDAVAFAPCDEADIVSCILFQLGAAAFTDHCAC